MTWDTVGILAVGASMLAPLLWVLWLLLFRWPKMDR